MLFRDLQLIQDNSIVTYRRILNLDMKGRKGNHANGTFIWLPNSMELYIFEDTEVVQFKRFKVL